MYRGGMAGFLDEGSGAGVAEKRIGCSIQGIRQTA